MHLCTSINPAKPPNETSSAINGMWSNPEVAVTPQFLTNTFGMAYGKMVNGSSASKNALMFVKLRQVRSTYGDCYTSGPTEIPFYNFDLQCVQPYSEATANKRDARPMLNESYLNPIMTAVLSTTRTLRFQTKRMLETLVSIRCKVAGTFIPSWINGLIRG